MCVFQTRIGVGSLQMETFPNQTFEVAHQTIRQILVEVLDALG